MSSEHHVSATTIHVRRYGMNMSYIPHCGCSWIGFDWTDSEPAERQRSSHECETGRQCVGMVTVRVVGTRPASSFERRCKRMAQSGQQTCPGHDDAEYATPFRPRPIDV